MCCCPLVCIDKVRMLIFISLQQRADIYKKRPLKREILLSEREVSVFLAENTVVAELTKPL